MDKIRRPTASELLQAIAGDGQSLEQAIIVLVELEAAGRIPLESGQRQLAKLSRQDDQVRAAIAVETSKPWSTKGARA